MPESSIVRLPIPERMERRQYEDRLADEKRHAAEEMHLHRERMRVHAKRALVGCGAMVTFGSPLLFLKPELPSIALAILFGCACMYTGPHVYKYDIHARRFYA